MKRKLSKGLVLGKRSIAILSRAAMAGIDGGSVYTQPTGYCGVSGVSGVSCAPNVCGGGSGNCDPSGGSGVYTGGGGSSECGSGSAEYCGG
jgi:hypothetical protein